MRRRRQVIQLVCAPNIGLSECYPPKSIPGSSVYIPCIAAAAPTVSEFCARSQWYFEGGWMVRMVRCHTCSKVDKKNGEVVAGFQIMLP